MRHAGDGVRVHAGVVEKQDGHGLHRMGEPSGPVFNGRFTHLCDWNGGGTTTTASVGCGKIIQHSNQSSVFLTFGNGNLQDSVTHMKP